MRGATSPLFWAALLSAFQSTRPMRGATHGKALKAFGEMFQSTRPMRGATEDIFLDGLMDKVSIHAPHAGRDFMPYSLRLQIIVSIHAPHAGRDRGCVITSYRGNVSIHAPHAGRDRRVLLIDNDKQGFQSTRPMRGATVCSFLFNTLPFGFNPRAPCGARRQKMSRLPSFATYLWVFPSTNTIFSAPETHAPPAA